MTIIEPILCFYTNNTGKLQLAKLQCELPFERLVFPSEKFMFEALPEGALEIYTYTTSGITLLEQIVCRDLEVRQKEAGKR